MERPRMARLGQALQARNGEAKRGADRNCAVWRCSAGEALHAGALTRVAERSAEWHGRHGGVRHGEVQLGVVGRGVAGTARGVGDILNNNNQQGDNQ